MQNKQHLVLIFLELNSKMFDLFCKKWRRPDSYHIFWHELHNLPCSHPMLMLTVSFQGRWAGQLKSCVFTVTMSLNSTGLFRLSGNDWQGVNAPLIVWVAVVVDWPSAALFWESFHLLWLRYKPKIQNSPTTSSELKENLHSKMYRVHLRWGWRDVSSIIIKLNWISSLLHGIWSW